MFDISATCYNLSHEQITYRINFDSENSNRYCRKSMTHCLDNRLVDSGSKCLQNSRILSRKFYQQSCVILNAEQGWCHKLRYRASSSWPSLLTVVMVASLVFRIAEACSSRSTPKPRAPLPTTSRPNITFQTYTCPEAYAKWYCLNGATCFSVKIGESILYNCECADGYMGQRCEFKDLDGSYAIKEREIIRKTASIAGSLGFAITAVVTCVTFYICLRRRQKRKKVEKRTLRALIIPVLQQAMPQYINYEDIDVSHHLCTCPANVFLVVSRKLPPSIEEVSQG
ncbi:protein spitz-like [Tachypleus tridentatus]|uniref:protein spitz-like n=1 Tax=Tachypleus tridentatus TaxID=6853 RepID=UPI003FD3EE9E